MDRFPQTFSAVVALLAGAVNTFVVSLGLPDGTTRLVVAILVAAVGLLAPAVHLRDPQTGEAITRDSQLSSVLLSAAAGVLAWFMANLPIPESADASLAGLLTVLVGILVPSAVARRRAGRGVASGP